MIITQETKERFVEMLLDRKVIIIQCSMPQRKNYSYKFIGANNFGKWDFTPLAAEYGGYSSNKNKCVENMVVYGLDAADIICNVLENIGMTDKFGGKSGNDLYEEVRSLLTTFFI